MLLLLCAASVMAIKDFSNPQAFLHGFPAFQLSKPALDQSSCTLEYLGYVGRFAAETFERRGEVKLELLGVVSFSLLRRSAAEICKYVRQIHMDLYAFIRNVISKM